MKTSTLIAKGKKYLWDGKDNKLLDLDVNPSAFICFAVLYAARDEPKNRRAALDCHEQLRAAIEARLFPWISLEAWLLHSAGIRSEAMTSERVQKHRLEWMNRLIKEYKAKGD